jgi:hypothetical protein
VPRSFSFLRGVLVLLPGVFHFWTTAVEGLWMRIARRFSQGFSKSWLIYLACGPMK